jgi:hypothetical protein
MSGFGTAGTPVTIAVIDVKSVVGPPVHVNTDVPLQVSVIAPEMVSEAVIISVAFADGIQATALTATAIAVRIFLLIVHVLSKISTYPCYKQMSCQSKFIIQISRVVTSLSIEGAELVKKIDTPRRRISRR